MNKFTPFKVDNIQSDSDQLLSKKKEKLPTLPKEETIRNILSFSKSYSVRKGKLIEKMEFTLN